MLICGNFVAGDDSLSFLGNMIEIFYVLVSCFWIVVLLLKAERLWKLSRKWTKASNPRKILSFWSTFAFIVDITFSLECNCKMMLKQISLIATRLHSYLMIHSASSKKLPSFEYIIKWKWNSWINQTLFCLAFKNVQSFKLKMQSKENTIFTSNRLKIWK